MPNARRDLDVESKICKLYNGVKSTKYEDIYLDIDFHSKDASKSYSVKHQPIAIKTGNFCFELEVQTEDGKWHHSWFSNGIASHYIIVVGNDIFEIKKSDLLAYVERFGWDSVRELSFQTQQLQKQHIHKNARIGLIKIRKLEKIGVARICKN